MTQAPSSKKPGKTDNRSQRLAAALRENLKRRKAQARSRRAEEAPVRETEPAKSTEYWPRAKE